MMGELLTGYLNKTIIMAFSIGLIVSLLLGPVIIPMLHKLKFGQNIRKDGPQSHMKKAGTPTIGGLIFLIAIVVVMVAMRYKLNSEGMIILYGALAFGLIGFLDDILKIIHKDNEGLTSGQKFTLQIFFSAALAYYGYKYIGTSITVPFWSGMIDLKLLYLPFVVFYFAAITNAVNLTDGLDGLATSVSILVFTFFSILAYNMGHYSVAVFAIGLVGALLGFLKYNAYKAKVFMGDTGSLAIGGALATMVMVLKTPIIVLIVGAIYVAETLSVILQVASFKLTGKRIFKMAPLHHHFEHCGWSEVKIVTVFSIITLLLCIVGFMSL